MTKRSFINRDNMYYCQTLRGNTKEIYSCKFFRLLRDDRETDSDDDALNENDCLNFSEFLTCRSKSDKRGPRDGMETRFITTQIVLKAKHVDKKGDFERQQRNVDMTKQD